MTADECAQLLADNNILLNNVGPKPGFNFRQMLRDGSDELIPLVKGWGHYSPPTVIYYELANGVTKLPDPKLNPVI